MKGLRSWPDARHTAADQVLQPYQSSLIKILTRGRDLIHVLGHDHVSHYCEYALSSTLSIFSKLIAIVWRDYEGCFPMLLLFFIYYVIGHVIMQIWAPSDEKLV